MNVLFSLKIKQQKKKPYKHVTTLYAVHIKFICRTYKIDYDTCLMNIHCYFMGDAVGPLMPREPVFCVCFVAVLGIQPPVPGKTESQRERVTSGEGLTKGRHGTQKLTRCAGKDRSNFLATYRFISRNMISHIQLNRISGLTCKKHDGENHKTSY